MWQRLRSFGQVLRRHPFLSALIVVLLVTVPALLAYDGKARSEYELARDCVRQEDYEEARAHLEKCRSTLWWRTRETTFLAARLERLLGNYEQARQLFDECLTYSGATSDASIQVEGLLLDAETGCGPGTFIPGQKVLWDLASKNDPDSAQIWRTIAAVTIRQSRYKEAMDAIGNWIKLKPDSAEAIEWRGTVLNMMNHSAGAEKEYRQALALAPKRHSTRVMLARLLLFQNRSPVEIRSHVDILIKANPNHPDYLLLLARCQLLEGDFAGATASLDKVLQVDPNNGTAMQVRGEIAMQSGDVPTAEVWLRKAVDHGMFTEKVLTLLKQSLERQGDEKKNEEAEQIGKKIKQFNADSIRVEQLLTGELQESNYATEKMVELGTIYLRGATPQIGEAWLAEVLAKEPNNVEAHAALAKYYADKDQKKAAAHAKLAK